MATANIPGDFLQTYDTSGSTHLDFDGMMEKLLAYIDPYLYKKYITTDKKSRKIMYAECLKALYGTLGMLCIIFSYKVSGA